MGHPCADKCVCATCLKRRTMTCNQCKDCHSGEYTPKCNAYVKDLDQYTNMETLRIPVYYYKSSSGKTYYAQMDFGSGYNYVRGESRESFGKALEDLQRQINEDHGISR